MNSENTVREPLGAGGRSALLLMDTCGERASVAVAVTGQIVAEEILPERTASTALLAAVGTVLRSAGLSLHDLDGLGVVHGPGSFTGVRVGLAVAKGLCEATGVPVAAVSRLAVLAEAGCLPEGGVAVLRAGRDEAYLRACGQDGTASEYMVKSNELAVLCIGKPVAYAEENVAGWLGAAKELQYVELRARHALRAVEEQLRLGGSDLAALDANYVRNEQAIYKRPQAGVL